MAAPNPTPATTLVIMLGASEFPKAPQLTAAKAFLNSACRLRHYFLDDVGFGLPQDNLLDLFDSQDPPPVLDERISDFIKQRGKQARDIIVYYCGHGGFSRDSSEYFLALRSTRDSNEYFSSYPVKALATTLKEHARSLRRFLILDSCFAAEAQKAFQSPSLEVARRKTLDEFPTKGTVLLCASGPRDPAKSLPDREITMFSSALLEILEKGDPDEEEAISIYHIGELVRSLIKEQFPDDAVRPEVHSPDQKEGDVALLPLFPNAAKKGTREKVPASQGHSGDVVTVSSATEHPKRWWNTAPAYRFVITAVVVGIGGLIALLTLFYLTDNRDVQSSKKGFREGQENLRKTEKKPRVEVYASPGSLLQGQEHQGQTTKDNEGYRVSVRVILSNTGKDVTGMQMKLYTSNPIILENTSSDESAFQYEEFIREVNPPQLSSGISVSYPITLRNVTIKGPLNPFEELKSRALLKVTCGDGLIARIPFTLVIKPPNAEEGKDTLRLRRPRPTEMKHTPEKVALPRQSLSWGPDQGKDAGACIDGCKDLVPWSQFSTELQNQVFSQIPNLPEDCSVQLSPLAGKPNRVIEVTDDTGSVVANVWVGVNPLAGWKSDGCLRVGTPGSPPSVWATFERLPNGNYRPN